VCNRPFAGCISFCCATAITASLLENKINKFLWYRSLDPLYIYIYIYTLTRIIIIIIIVITIIIFIIIYTFPVNYYRLPPAGVFVLHARELHRWTPAIIHVSRRGVGVSGRAAPYRSDLSAAACPDVYYYHR